MMDYIKFENNPDNQEYSFYKYGKYHIPDYMVDGIKNYLRHGIRPGSFLYAVLENNLTEAVAFADKDNMANLPAYAYWLMNEVPTIAWGSEENVETWIRMGGFEGMKEVNEGGSNGQLRK